MRLLFALSFGYLLTGCPAPKPPTQENAKTGAGQNNQGGPNGQGNSPQQNGQGGQGNQGGPQGGPDGGQGGQGGHEEAAPVFPRRLEANRGKG